MTECWHACNTPVPHFKHATWLGLHSIYWTPPFLKTWIRPYNIFYSKRVWQVKTCGRTENDATEPYVQSIGKRMGENGRMCSIFEYEIAVGQQWFKKGEGNANMCFAYLARWENADRLGNLFLRCVTLWIRHSADGSGWQYWTHGDCQNKTSSW